MVSCLARRPWPFGPVGWTLLLALLTIGGGGRVAALEPSTRISQYRHQRWAQENGLPRNTVNDIAQTGDGYLWVATELGLARFNGSAFTVFNRDTAPGLRANHIATLQPARDGSLWLGFRAGFGIARIQNGSIDPDPQRAGVTNHTVLHLCEDREGRLVDRRRRRPAQFEPAQRWQTPPFQRLLRMAGRECPGDSSRPARANLGGLEQWAVLVAEWRFHQLRPPARLCPYEHLLCLHRQ